ncbi:hypothetical protein LK09_06590 [Microbacterium mangrovi]|uniref:Helicase XPB/Ssl2 N-terminal domain-containing protein n=1 Tax=Microbacterium mangrovi TaxID=1348253 RepID=A0A0B2AAH2_9MICO|nr:helicase-associated domain-containing protein [Microbacterium mangrovi]KHK98616.1 hypothetical protein LK09_06590 [Microbacterium mangrovi]
MTGTSDERALATRLSGMDADALAELLVDRGVAASVTWIDAFDAAEALLDPVSIDSALRGLSRDDLRALAAGTPAARPAALALARSDGTPYAAVAARLEAARAAHPDAFAAVSAPADPAAADQPEAGAAAERAAAAVASLADILAASRVRPLTTTAAESVTAADRRHLVDEGVIAEASDLDDLITAAAAARLVVLRDREWRLTVVGDAWLMRDAVARWVEVATGLVALLPRDRTGRILPPDAWAGSLPLDPSAPVRAEALRRVLVRWGLLTADGSAPAWSAGVWRPTAASGSAAGLDAGALAAMLTPEIAGIYLQADLSAIAPGPLEPALDLRLRTMAERESRAQASTYRFSEQSLAGAVALGETAETLREFLGALSLTGIPQPLDYLIDQVTSARGVLRVGTDAPTGRARIDGDDPHLLDMLLVDRTLRPLGLQESGDALTSRVSRDAVFWSLADARYRVVALDADGRPEPLNRRRPLVDPEDAPTGDDRRALAERLLAGRGDSDAAWLERELDQAVRLRAPVILTVLLPDGSTRELQVEAQGLGGGRFRGLDRAADVERTVPLASIASVRPA